jgi:hypothetical protein
VASTYDQVPRLFTDLQQSSTGRWYRESPNGTRRMAQPVICLGCRHLFIALKAGQKWCSRGCSNRARLTQDAVGYGGAHHRVRRARGPASEYLCADCGEQAAHWSQVHGMTGLEPEHYAPRCVSCHGRYDSETRRRGENHGQAKLTNVQVQEIRCLYGSGRWTQQRLAERFGVHQTRISHLVAGRKR